MENQGKFELTRELKKSAVEFLESVSSYKECLDKLKDEEKLVYTESEVNEILNLLGSFRLRDVYHIVERFKIEVTQLKSSTEDEKTEPASSEQQ